MRGKHCLLVWYVLMIDILANTHNFIVTFEIVVNLLFGLFSIESGMLPIHYMIIFHCYCYLIYI